MTSLHSKLTDEAGNRPTVPATSYDPLAAIKAATNRTEAAHRTFKCGACADPQAFAPQVIKALRDEADAIAAIYGE
jgi:hypothetical protein